LIFAQQAQRDWETILIHRARELKPGGRLVLVNFCKDEAGEYASRVKARRTGITAGMPRAG
jgi:hypothetical protein